MKRSSLFACLFACLAAGCRPGAADHLERARDAVFEKRSDEALVEYRKALDALRDEEGEHARVLRARALKGAADVYWLEQHKVKEAVSVYRELIQQAPESPEALEGRITLARLLRMYQRDVRGAIDQLAAALARNPPQGAELHYEVAKLYFALGDFPQCVLEARRLAERFATSPWVDDARFLEAQALQMMEGKRQEAAHAFADLRARFPDSELEPYAAFELGKLRAEAGEHEKAIEVWVGCLQRHPQPQLVQDAINRSRRRLASTTPAAVGVRAAAFDRGVARPAPAPVAQQQGP